jgi:flagellar biosynthesis/type III secretory pathway chaperone
MDEEAACYHDLETILADEEDSISLSRKDRFDLVQLEKDALVVKLQLFEEQRKSLVDQLSDDFFSDRGPLTISQLVPFVKPPFDEKLLARADCLRTTISHVQKKNKRNQLLINQYLDLVKGSLKLLNNLIDNTSIYQRPGTSRASVGYQSGGGRLICGTV